jgi:dephospho-CoA kinase
LLQPLTAIFNRQYCVRYPLFLQYCVLTQLSTVIGLTGGIATGKTNRIVAEVKGQEGPNRCADVLARQVVQAGTPALPKIVKYFGPSILLPDGSLDRKRLSSIILNDEAKRRKLNPIILAAVSYAISWNALLNWLNGEKMSIVDLPLLIGGGFRS